MSVRLSMNESTNQPTNQATDQSIDHPTNQPTIHQLQLQCAVAIRGWKIVFTRGSGASAGGLLSLLCERLWCHWCGWVQGIAGSTYTYLHLWQWAHCLLVMCKTKYFLVLNSICQYIISEQSDVGTLVVSNVIYKTKKEYWTEYHPWEDICSVWDSTIKHYTLCSLW